MKREIRNVAERKFYKPSQRRLDVEGVFRVQEKRCYDAYYISAYEIDVCARGKYSVRAADRKKPRREYVQKRGGCDGNYRVYNTHKHKGQELNGQERTHRPHRARGNAVFETHAEIR